MSTKERFLIWWQNKWERELSLREIPEGFDAVIVIVTEKERKQLEKEANLVASGTSGEVMRQWANMPGMPYGLRAAMEKKYPRS